MSDVHQQDFDMINAKLTTWREDPKVEGFACILIARKPQNPLREPCIAANFHGLWSREVMSEVLKRASGLILREIERQDAAQRKAQ